LNFFIGIDIENISTNDYTSKFNQGIVIFKERSHICPME